MSQKKIQEQTGFWTTHLQEEQMNSLQKNCRLQSPDVLKEIEDLTMMVNNLQMMHLWLIETEIDGPFELFRPGTITTGGTIVWTVGGLKYSSCTGSNWTLQILTSRRYIKYCRRGILYKTWNDWFRRQKFRRGSCTDVYRSRKLSQLNECDVNGFQDLSGSFVVDSIFLTIKHT